MRNTTAKRIDLATAIRAVADQPAAELTLAELACAYVVATLDAGGEQRMKKWLGAFGHESPRGAPPVKVGVAKLVQLTTQTTPEAATHWSTRKMGEVLGISPSTVMRHWQAHGLKPHIVRGFKVSRDPKFADKLEDIVGLYMSPPEHALVLCCDEKSQVQALTPTSASWLNMVERFFRDLTTERLRRGVFTSVPELVTAINAYVAHHNIDPKPFIWTKTARDILQKVIRANGRLSSKQNGTLH